MRRWILPLFLLVFSAAMAILSPGFFESDELTHFLKAREMLHDWSQVLDIWGRPACTGLFGLAAAMGGLVGARLFAVIITALTAWGTSALYGALRLSNDNEQDTFFHRGEATWLWLLLYAQPLFLLNSFTVMTEMLLACAWVWAAILLIRGRFAWAGVVLGLGGLARPEGWLAIAAWPFLLVLWRAVAKKSVSSRIVTHWSIGRSIACSIAPMVAWWGTGWAAYHHWRWMIDYFPWQARSQYGTTGLLFLASSLAALAVWMWIPVILATAVLWRRRDRVALFMLVLPAAFFFLLHGTLGLLGLMGSMSLPRYFICVSPFLSILALIGLQSFASRTQRPRLLRKAVILLILMPAFLLISLGQLPVPKSPDLQQLDAVITAFEQRVPRPQWSERLIAGNPYVYYRTGIPMDTPLHNRIFHREAMRTAPAGTYLITDNRLWGRENRPTRQELLAWNYELLAVPERIPSSFDISTFGPALQQDMPVGLWVKEK